jgi:hypothetical protein
MITKLEIEEYIDLKPHINIYPYGQFWRVRIGERSTMDGKYTKKDYAERALNAHVGNVIECNRKLQDKRRAKSNAEKAKS